MFDDDDFDAETLVLRAGHASFDKFTLAKLLGIAPGSVSQLRTRGKIPPPAFYEDATGLSGHKRALWTCAQASDMLANKMRMSR